MIANASLSAFSSVAPAARSGGATPVAGAALEQLRGKAPAGVQAKPGNAPPVQLAPGQVLPRGSLLDRSV